MSVTVSSLTMQLSMVSLPTLGHSQSQFGSNRMPYPGTIFHRTKLGHPLMAKHKLCLRFLPKWSHRWMHAYGAKANQVFLNPREGGALWKPITCTWVSDAIHGRKFPAHLFDGPVAAPAELCPASSNTAGVRTSLWAAIRGASGFPGGSKHGMPVHTLSLVAQYNCQNNHLTVPRLKWFSFLSRLSLKHWESP